MTIYKYVTADRIDILKNGLIRFTQPTALNDPWEVKPYIESLMTDETWNSEIRTKAIEQIRGTDFWKDLAEKVWKEGNRKQRRSTTPRKIEAYLRLIAQNNPLEFERVYLGYFNMLVDEVVLREKEVISLIPETLNQSVGILSLSEIPNHTLMWAHYSGSYTGFVIAFDENHNFFTTRRSNEDELGGLHKIEYSEVRPNLKSFIDFSEEHLSSLSAKFFFTKGKEWYYEQELRMIKPLQEANNILENSAGNIHLFNLPFDCITGLILGNRIDPEIKKEIVELISNSVKLRHIKISELVLSEITYDIEIIHITE